MEKSVLEWVWERGSRTEACSVVTSEEMHGVMEKRINSERGRLEIRIVMVYDVGYGVCGRRRGGGEVFELSEQRGSC